MSLLLEPLEVEPIPGALPLVPAVPLVPDEPPLMLAPLLPALPELPLDPELPDAPALSFGKTWPTPPEGASWLRCITDGSEEVEVPLVPEEPEAPEDPDEAPEEPLIPLLPAPLASVAPELDEPLLPAPALESPVEDDDFLCCVPFLCLSDFLCLVVFALSMLELPELMESVEPLAPEDVAPEVELSPDIAPAPLEDEPDGMELPEELVPPVACATTAALSPCLLGAELFCAAEIPAADSSEMKSARDTFFIVTSKNG